MHNSVTLSLLSSTAPHAVHVFAVISCCWQVAGGRRMQLRVSDPDYLDHVSRWFGVLLPRLAPYTIERGGPILMTQARPFN